MGMEKEQKKKVTAIGRGKRKGKKNNGRKIKQTANLITRGKKKE